MDHGSGTRQWNMVVEHGSGPRMEGEELEGGWNASVICGGIGDDGCGDCDIEDGTKDGCAEVSFENRVSLWRWWRWIVLSFFFKRIMIIF